MNRETLDLLKARTTEEGLPVFINHKALFKALGTKENITLIPMTLDELKELIVAEGGVSIDCTNAETSDHMFKHIRRMVEALNVRFERCSFSQAASGAKLHSGVYITVIANKVDPFAGLESVMTFWYVTTRTDLIR